jgi:sigma-B regulation protein RsbU (phosphoserine phosphatase)
LLGILEIGPRRGDLPYSRADKSFLWAVAWQVAYAIENNRLVQHMVREEHLQREIEIASDVQRRLFPDRPPASRRLDLHGLCVPAQGVGGDYYDFIDVGDGRIGLAVADVAGKGISAALLMSVVQASLRSQARLADGSLKELVSSMNGLLYRSTARNSFASFFYGVIDETDLKLTYVNAGHNPPLLVRGNGAQGRPPTGSSHVPIVGGRAAAAVLEPMAVERHVEALEVGGLVLGVSPTAVYEQHTVSLHAGDIVVAYTDGVTEAFSARDEEFGDARLCELTLASCHLPAREIAERIVASVHEWSRGAPQHDDITLLVARIS